MQDLLCLLWYFNVCVIEKPGFLKTCTSWIPSTIRDKTKPWAWICWFAFPDSPTFISRQSTYLASNLQLSTTGLINTLHAHWPNNSGLPSNAFSPLSPSSKFPLLADQTRGIYYLRNLWQSRVSQAGKAILLSWPFWQWNTGIQSAYYYGYWRLGTVFSHMNCNPS